MSVDSWIDKPLPDLEDLNYLWSLTTLPDGTVTSVKITNNGSGYTKAPVKYTPSFLDDVAKQPIDWDALTMLKEQEEEFTLDRKKTLKNSLLRNLED